MKNLYSAIFKAFPLPSLLLLPDAQHFIIADVNTAYLKVTGKKEPELAGKDIFDVFRCKPGDLTSDDASNLRHSLFTVIRTGKPHTMATRKCNIPMGSDKFTVRYWDSENTPVTDHEGNVAGIIYTVTDITEKKLQHEKQQLLASEYKITGESNRLQTELLNTIGLAIIATKPDGVINFWNKAATQIYGWNNEEAIGKNVVDIMPGQKTTKQANEIIKQLLQGHSWSGEFTVQRKNGQVFPVSVTNSPLYDQNHKLSGMIGASYDITEQKKAKEQNKKQWNNIAVYLSKILQGFIGLL